LHEAEKHILPAEIRPMELFIWITTDNEEEEIEILKHLNKCI
jgi:hypothetical protein